MKRIVFIIAFLVGLSFFTNAQNNYVVQPDSAKIFIDTTYNPDYGGVYDFRCSYNADGLLTEREVMVFSEETDQCLHRGNTYRYDSNHNVTYDEYLGYDCLWNISGIRFKTENVYLYNLIRSQTTYIAGDHGIGWILWDSATYHYDNARRLTSKESYDSNHAHTSTIHYEYGDLKKVITTEQLKNNQWMVTKRQTQSFSDDDLLLSKMTEVGDDGLLSNSLLVTYSYDNQGHCERVLTQEWENESWVNVKMVVNSYDGNGHLVVATLKKWQDGAFVDANRAVYELNEVGYPVVVSFEKWRDDSWVEGTWLSDFYVYSESHLSRQNEALCDLDVRRLEIHYANTPMPDYDVDEHPTEQGFCTLYPNPTNGFITVMGKDLKTAEVLNTLGQRVATVTGQGETLQIDIAELPTGVYFVSVTDGKGRKCVKKVVKE